MNNDSVKKMIIVALGVCLVCSVLVSSLAVGLKPLQYRNRRLDKIKNILIAGDLYKKGVNVEEVFNQKVESILVSVETGEVIPEERYTEILQSTTFSVQSLADNPAISTDIPSRQDIADIRTKPKYMPVYQLKKDGQVFKYIFPVYGRGLWSTMWGFIALDKDLKTIRGITFFDHGETPGLGGEIDNPSWQQQWNGKKAFDQDDQVQIQVIKGQVDQTEPDAKYKIDGLSGATLTTRGVNNLVRFWLGENGYGPFIDKNRKEGLNEQS